MRVLILVAIFDLNVGAVGEGTGRYYIFLKSLSSYFLLHHFLVDFIIFII